MKLKVVFLIVFACQTTMWAQRVTSIDIVKINAAYEKEAQYFYTQNWEAFRKMALEQQVISGYSLLRTATDSTQHFTYILMTEYADSASFRKMEENFRPIMKSISPNGPKMLNDVPRNKFLTYVASYDAFGKGMIEKNAGFKTHYHTFGQGAPILIINGGPGMNSNGFAGVAEKIAEMGFQTIIYDQRGTGKSTLDSLNNQTITMDLMVEDMEQLRKKLNISKWTVMGHSFGGLLATHYFEKHGDKVEKLIFSSSGGVNMNFTKYVNSRLMGNLTQIQRDSLNFYQNKLSNGDTTMATRLKRASFMANAYVFDKNHAQTIATRLIEVNFALNGLVFQDLNKIKFDHTNQFVQNQTPVLIIQGKNDVISTETAAEIKQSFGNAELHLLDNCGHYGWLDQPKSYFGILNNFLKKGN